MTDIQEKLERFGDSTKIISCAEHYLLERIAETSSDLIQGHYCPEFSKCCGGREKLEQAHEQAIQDYEQWLSDGEG